eukprot:32388_1
MQLNSERIQRNTNINKLSKIKGIARTANVRLSVDGFIRDILRVMHHVHVEPSILELVLCFYARRTNIRHNRRIKQILCCPVTDSLDSLSLQNVVWESLKIWPDGIEETDLKILELLHNENGTLLEVTSPTTDLHQLSRGHTQWVNQVMHHPIQNGIAITASDDCCVMFWRFKKWQATDELKALEKKAALQGQIQTQNEQNNWYIDRKLQWIPGEIELLPVLKIHTGSEVKSIAMSSSGTILACTCCDEEEDEVNPELQLYFDVQQKWTFKHHQFNPDPYFGNVGKKRDHMMESQNQKQKDLNESSEDNGGRFISRHTISLPFEPLPHSIVFSRDNKHVFVAMYSSETILRGLIEDLEEEFGGRDNMDDEALRLFSLRKWPDHPVSLCCVDVHTKRLSECEKIWKYLGEDEHVQCMAISPNGAQIAIGSSLGQLIVTGVLDLTDDFDDDAEEINSSPQKLWSSNMLLKDKDKTTNASDRSICAIEWSPDSNWIICGHASGAIKFWNKIEEKLQTFDYKHHLQSTVCAAINSISIRGTIMVSGSDDGNVIIYDLSQTIIDSGSNDDTSPIAIGRIDNIHGGRMVNSVALTKNYSEQPNAHFMVTSGADQFVHCVNIIDVCRDTIRKNYSKKAITIRKNYSIIV